MLVYNENAEQCHKDLQCTVLYERTSNCTKSLFPPDIWYHPVHYLVHPPTLKLTMTLFSQFPFALNLYTKNSLLIFTSKSEIFSLCRGREHIQEVSVPYINRVKCRGRDLNPPSRLELEFTINNCVFLLLNNHANK